MAYVLAFCRVNPTIYHIHELRLIFFFVNTFHFTQLTYTSTLRKVKCICKINYQLILKIHFTLPNLVIQVR